VTDISTMFGGSPIDEHAERLEHHLTADPVNAETVAETWRPQSTTDKLLWGLLYELQGQHVAPIPHYTLAAPAVDVLMASGIVICFGWSVKETAGAAASFTIGDGLAVAGLDQVFPVALNANETNREWFGPQGIVFEQGLFFHAVAGALTGAVFFRAVKGPRHVHLRVGG